MFCLQFSQQLHWFFRYPLQDFQKATTWGDVCGTRRERMVLPFLSSRDNSAIKKIKCSSLHKGLCKYLRSRGFVFHGLLWISEVLDFHAVESQYIRRIKESL